MEEEISTIEDLKNKVIEELLEMTDSDDLGKATFEALSNLLHILLSNERQ